MSKIPLAVNTSFTVKPFETRLAVVETVASYPGGADDYGIWCAGSVNIAKRQSVVGTYKCMYRYALTRMNRLPVVGDYTTIYMPVGGTVADITVNGTPSATDIRLYIGSDRVLRDQLTFTTAFNTLIDAFLEASQGN